MQQAFLAAFLALTRRGQRPAEPDRWLRAIARNQCFSALRARKSVEPIREELDGSPRTPYDEVACRTEVRGMMADLGRLPSEQRSALVLAELDEIPHAAIAEELDCRPSKVKALVFQARELLGAFRDARDLPCGVVRAQLEESRVGRPQARITRHLKVCPDCEEFAHRGRHS